MGSTRGTSARPIAPATGVRVERTASDEEWEVELARALVARSNQLRTMLIEMNPITDPAYDTLFQALVIVDADIRKLRASIRERLGGW